MTIPTDIAKRRDRAIATLLSFKEEQLDPYLPEELRAKTRSLILDVLNDLVLSVAANENGKATVVMNELFLDKLNAIHDYIMSENA